MRIAKDKAVTLEYTLSGDDGETIETSKGKEPLSYIHGSGGLIKGFETALEGKSAKDTFTFTVSPEEGYGERRQDLLFRVSREQLGQIPELKIGMPLRVQTSEGAMVAMIGEIHDDHVILDANHPLSGKILTFAVEILEVRDASSEELEEAHEEACGCGSSSCGTSSCGDSCGGGCC
jgi:FKBP-type peptidyl-prolyl cis-trans isomerase SlyD